MAEERRAVAAGERPASQPPGTPADNTPNTPGGGTPFAANSAPVKAWESDDDEEEERNCKIGCRLHVGHIMTEKEKASIKLNIASSDLQGTVGGTAAPGAQSPSRAGTRGGTAGGDRPASRVATASSHIRLFAKELLDAAFRSSPPEWSAKYEEFATNGGFGSVAWLDFPINETASEEMVSKMIKQIEMFLDSVPKDYAKPLYVASKVSVRSLTSRDVRRFLRIELFSDRDPFTELEKLLPPKTVLKDVIDHLSLNVLLNVSLDELLELTKQFVNYEHKCYGPQEEELGEKGMDPSVYMNSVKQRRKAALRAAKAAGNKDMSVKEVSGACAPCRGENDRIPNLP
jgi:hypothetical protein